MSTVTAASAFGPQTPSDVATPSRAATNQAPATESAVPHPAVIVSLSSEATTAALAKPALPVLDPDAVDNALARVGGGNQFADNAAHYSWSVVAAKFGKAIADRDQAAVEGGASGAVSYALASTLRSGVPIKNSVNAKDFKVGATTDPITVDDFSFTSGGSTYSVTHGKNGTLVGTKDGQAWKTWQLNNPSSSTDAATPSGSSAAIALQTLTSLNTEQKVAINKPHAGVDISA